MNHAANMRDREMDSAFWMVLPVISMILLVSWAIYVGWNIRGEYYITAESGIGYALGIIGGVMMLLLLIYPLRKRFYHSSVFIFSTKRWFQLHMVLGILGPLLILFHSNFRLGSTNSTVALGSMLLMVTSGIIGRYIYSKTHHGLYGNKIKLEELQNSKLLAQIKLKQDSNAAVLIIESTLAKQLYVFDHVVSRQAGIWHRFYIFLSLGLGTRNCYYRLVRQLRRAQSTNDYFLSLSKTEQRAHLQPVEHHMAMYLSTIRKIASLSFYERLFSLWHILHLPIFFMLIITGIVHVYAVHAY